MNVFNIIIYLITDLLMTYTMIICCNSILKYKIYFSFTKIFLIIIFSCCIVLNNLINIISLRFVIAIIISILMNFIVFSKNYKRVLNITIVYCIISIIIDIVLSTFISNMMNIELFNKNIMLKVLYSLVEIIITILFFYNKKIINNLNKIKIIKNFKLNYYVVSLIIIFFLNLLTIYRGVKLNNITFLIITLMCILVMIISINTIIKDKYNIRILEERNKNLKDSYKAYSNTIEECREMKHNLKNDLYSLKAFLPKENQEKLNMTIMKYNTNYEWINKIDDIPEGIQGIIYLKIHEAKQKKVKILLNTKRNIQTNEKDYLDLCVIIGILIDNAIESSSKTKKKVIEIDIKEIKNVLTIKITNCFGNVIDVDKIGQKKYSTKEYKSGLGLNYIKKIKNINLKVKFSIINDLFITKIIYKEKSTIS